MSMSVSLKKSTTKTNIDHNNRTMSDKEKERNSHIDYERSDENKYLIQEDIRDLYKREFGEALENYNAKQRRSDRKIKDYYKHIEASKKTSTQQEMIIQIGDKDDFSNNENREIVNTILEEWFHDFEKRNPNLKVYNAVIHNDEASPHMHLNFVPVASGYKRGLEKQVAFDRAIIQQDSTLNKTRPFEDWREKEVQLLEQKLLERGIERKIVGTNKYKDVNEYKEKKDLEREIKQLEHDLSEKKNELLAFSEEIPIEIETKARRQMKNVEVAAVTNTPYHSIAIAALLPAILYYIALFLMIHFEAIRLDLPRADETQIPKVSDVLKRGWFYFIPVLVLITLLLSGYSPSRTGFFGIISIIIISWFQPKKRMKIGEIIQALAEGAKTAIPISSACAAAGLVIAGIMTTGLGGKLSSIILNITSGQLLPSLLLIMIMCIILGMGMPVAAAYVLTAMLAAPTLINLGVSEIAAHLFIVYFSIISAITPPVAVASFAAAGIAKANPTTVGFEAVRLGLVSFIIPFIFVFQPGLLMEGTILDVIITFSVSVLGITALCYLMIFALPKVGHLFHLSVNRN